jgi:hypothetical protein
MRLLFNKDLFPLELIPERLDAFLRDFVEINGLLFYLLLKIFGRISKIPLIPNAWKPRGSES